MNIRKMWSQLALILISVLLATACVTQSPSSKGNISNKGVVDTGQTASYNSDGEEIVSVNGEAFYGQDGDYSGLDFSFRDNGDGTVTDLNTGLTWLQQSSDEKMTWQNAMDYCEDLEYAGRDDWRAPTLTELISIENFSDGWPYLDMDVFSFGDREISKALQFWSSNYYYAGTTHEGAETAFGLNFGTGHIKGYPTGDGMDPDMMPEMDDSNGGPVGVSESENKSSEGPSDGNPPPPGMDDGGNRMAKYIWAVAGDEYGVSQFVDNGDGTISDLGTGLMWKADDSGEGLDWENSLAYAEEMEYAGYDDWRLPNVKELQSIVDYSGVYPAIDKNYFSISDEDSYFWSSTSAYFSKMSDEELKKYWAWYVAFGFAVGSDGEDLHGAGAIRYDSKAEGGPSGEDAERVYNYARAVRSID